MNDLMSLGIHRCWKDSFVEELGRMQASRNQEVPFKALDVAGGTGDIAFRIYDKFNQLNNVYVN